jgi:hypothetical protein
MTHYAVGVTGIEAHLIRSEDAAARGNRDAHGTDEASYS